VTRREETRVSADVTRRFTPGSLIAGRYRIVELLGVGGMGLVYLADDQELGITVALKIIRPEIAADPSLIDRFRRELLLGRQVSHPNVVRIHDIGQDGDLHFLTMDYVAGCSLRKWMADRGRASEEETVVMLRPIAEALGAAHRAGVVHRDLKPANILVDADGRPHIADFGLARSLAASGLTQAGAVMGTPDYLSPEQAKGESVDARTDVYALGVIAFEMLSGELPFPGGSFAETIAQRIAGRPRDLSEFGVQVSPRLRRLLQRSLEPSPARRVASAEEFLGALDGAPVRPRFGRAALVAAGVVLAVVAAVAIGRRFVDRAPGTPPSKAVSVAVLPLRDETGSKTLAWMSTGIAELLTDALTQSPTLRVVDAGHVARTLRDLKLDAGPWSDETLRRIGQLLDAEILFVGSARARGELLRVDAQLVRVAGAGGRAPVPIAVEAPTPGGLVQAIARDLDRSLDVPVPKTALPVSDSAPALAAFHEASELLARGDAVLAEPALERAVVADPAFGAAWYKLAEVREASGQRERALEAADRAVQTLEVSDRWSALAQARQATLRGEPDQARQILSELSARYPGDVETAVALADAYGHEGQLTEARRVLEKVVAQAPNHPRGWYLLGKYAILEGDSRKAVDDYLVRALVVQNNLRSRQGRADVLNAFGVGYRELGELQQAQEKYQEAAALRQDLGDRRGYATTLRNLAQIQTARGAHDEAAKTLVSAIAIFDALGDRAGRADAVNDEGVNEEARGDYRKALTHYRDALQVRRDLGDRRAEAESLNNVGYANQLLGDNDNASVYWNQALEVYKETGNREGQILVTQSLGQLQLARGQWDEAVKSYLKALEQSREDERLPTSAVSLESLGRVAQYQGRYAAALASYGEGLTVLEGLKDNGGLAEVALARAETWIELGRPEDARADLTRADGLIGEEGSHEQRAEWLRLDAQVRACRGDIPGARAALSRARSEGAASQNPAVLLRLEIEEGRQLLRERRTSDALRSLKASAASAEKLGEARLRLASQEALARACLAVADPAAAERAASQALRIAESCGSYAGAVRLYRLRAAAAKARGDVAAEKADLDRAGEALARLREGLDTERAGTLTRTIEEDRL